MTTRGMPGVLSGSGAEGAPLAIPFPSDDQSTGVVSIGWRGPAFGEHAIWTRLKLLWLYLTESAVAPLTKVIAADNQELRCVKMGWDGMGWVGMG